jgi:hypothetical protein
MKITIICSLAAAGLLAGCGENRVDSTSPDQNKPAAQDRAAPKIRPRTAEAKFNDLPAAVQITVKEHAGAAEIADVGKETKKGQIVFAISFKEPGKNPKMQVAEDGTLIQSDLMKNEAIGTPGVSIQTETAAGDFKLGIKFSDLPTAVLQTIQERAPYAEIADIDKETRSGQVVYEISFKEEGKNPKLHVAEDGTIVEDLRK